MAMHISDHAHPKIEITFLAFPNLHQHVKYQFIPLTHSLGYSQFQSPVTRLTMPIFDHVHPKNFGSTFDLCELVSTCKKSGDFIDLFRRYGWLKNPAIWLPDNILAHISENFFSQIWDLWRNTINNICFHYRTNPVKINDQIFQ